MAFAGAALVDAWLEPLTSEAGPCGPDFQYDNDYLALTQAAAGKPKTTFDDEVPPDWRAVRVQAESLLGRTRDLRIALLWLRAMLHLEGFAALPDGLRLLHGLLERHWENLHPQPDPDDGDPYARMNVLAELPENSRVLGDLRRAVLFSARGFGDIRVRAVEVVHGHLPARDDDPALGKEQLAQLLAAAVAQDPELPGRPAQALAQFKQLEALLQSRVDAVDVPDFKPLQSLLRILAIAMPSTAVLEAEPSQLVAVAVRGTSADAPPGAVQPVPQVGLAGQVQSRDDAVRAIDMVCEYLERTEPSSPAPLLLRRARRLINHNFLQLMKELAPEALAEVARVMGVDPESVQVDSS